MTNAGNMEEIWKEFEAASVKNQTKVNAQQRKFPGEVKPAGKLDFELETFRKSIEKCTLPEIKDILARQDAILSNSKLMKTLPDKGLKVQLKKKKVEELIESRTKAIDEASELLSGLKLIDTNSLEFRLGGAMYKHLNIPDEQTKVPFIYYVSTFITKTGFFRQYKRISFSTLHFDEIFMLQFEILSTNRKKMLKKFVKMLWFI